MRTGSASMLAAVLLAAFPYAAGGRSSTSQGGRGRCEAAVSVFGSPTRRPRQLSAPADARLRRSLGVFARPRTKADAVPQPFGGFRFYFGFAAVNTRSIRYVGKTDIGDHYYVIPGYVAQPRPLSDRCRRLLSRSERHAAAVSRHLLATPAERARIELLSVSDDGQGSSGVTYRAHDVELGQALDYTPSSTARSRRSPDSPSTASPRPGSPRPRPP